MTIIGRANKTTTVRVFLFLALSPFYGDKATGVTVKAGIVRLVGTTAPRPGTGFSCHYPYNVTVIAVPKSVNPFIKFRPLQLHPHIYIGVIVVVGVLGKENNFLHFPRAYGGILSALSDTGRRTRTQGDS